jgi:hypothetical protein
MPHGARQVKISRVAAAMGKAGAAKLFIGQASGITIKCILSE